MQLSRLVVRRVGVPWQRLVAFTIVAWTNSTVVNATVPVPGENNVRYA
jgi:predicted phosphoribosyltransferase